MRISVLYFASLREAVGRGREDIDVPVEVASVAALRAWIVGRGEPWAAAFAQVRQVRVSVDRKMASDRDGLREGAEVAFFPPVTGG